MKTFTTVWLGQIVSLLGSGLTNFGLGVWVYQQTGSATLFATIALFAMLPGILVAPLAGIMVDRWDRRVTMLGSDVLCGLAVAVAAWLVMRGEMRVPHVMILAAFTSACSAFQVPAYQAAVSTLVPKEQLGRSAGMVQMGQAVADLASPILAGAAFALLHLQGLIFLDFCSFLVGAATLAFVRFPQVVKEKTDAESRSSLKEEFAQGWRFIRQRRGLMYMLGYFASLNFLLPMASVLFGPLVLSFSGPTGLGTTMSIMGMGMLVGSILVSVTGGIKNKVVGVFTFGGLLGLFMAGVGLHAAVWSTAAAGFFLMFCAPFTNGCSQALWQSKVPHELQGRVFSVRRMIAQGTAPIAMLCTGPLVDKVFGPLMMPNGALASSVGTLIGTGPGRGAGLCFVVMGALTLLVSTAFLMSRTMRHLEKDIPDVQPLAPAAA